MNSIDKSFRSLVKYNNGLFKSDKQAKFLLSQCDDNTYVINSMAYRNAYMDVFDCDDRGIVKVARYSEKVGLLKVIFERDESITMDDLQAKKEKYLNNKERILLINRLQDKWMNKREQLLPKNNLDEIVEMINSDRKDEAAVYAARLEKVSESIYNRVARICTLRDKLVCENAAR